MPTYNPNDFYPASGAKVKSDGTIANTADGYNSDGSENVQIEGTTGNKLAINADGSQNVQVTGSLPTGTNSIGKVLKNNSYDVYGGNCDTKTSLLGWSFSFVQAFPTHVSNIV